MGQAVEAGGEGRLPHLGGESAGRGGSGSRRKSRCRGTAATATRRRRSDGRLSASAAATTAAATSPALTERGHGQDREHDQSGKHERYEPRLGAR